MFYEASHKPHGKSLVIWTARIGYKGLEGETVLDTTAKSAQGIGKVFAPTWHMVMDYKKGAISWEEYEQKYTALMRARWGTDEAAFVEACNSGSIVLLCYCENRVSQGQRCHRYILVRLLSKVAKSLGITPIYKGEVI